MMHFCTDLSTLLRIANFSKTSCAELRDGQRNDNWCLTSINARQALSLALTQFTYSSGNVALVSTETFTYLGVLVHSSLLYREHINHTLRKASRTLYAIMRALKGASQQAKRTAFLVSACLSLNTHLKFGIRI